MNRPHGAVRLALRQLVTDRVAVGVVALVVAVSAALAAAQPRALDALFTDGLRDRVAAAGAPERDLVVRAAEGGVPLELSDPDDPLVAVQRVADGVRDSLPAGLRALTGPATFAVTIASLSQASLAPVLRTPLGPTVWDLAAYGGLDERVSWVGGRAPVGARGVDGGDPLSDSGQPRPVVVEMAVSATAAAEIGLDVGSTVTLDDLTTLEVVGVFAAADVSDPFWQWHGGVLDPPIQVTPDGDVREPVAVVGSAAWPVVQSQFFGGATALLRVPVTDADSASAAQAPQLLAEVRQAQGQPRTSPGPYLASFRVSTELDQVLLEHLQAQAAATSVVSVTVAGLLVVCLAVLALAVRLLLERRRRTLALAVARGASSVQLRVLLAGEGLLVGLVAAAVGAAVGAWLVPGASGRWGVLLPAALGLAPAVLLPALARPGGLRAERRDVSRRARRWRAAADLLVVAAATAAAVLVRRRGLGTPVTTSGGEVVEVPDVGVDPLLALAPVLLALALALLLVRVYPRPLVALAAVAARRPAAVPFLGAARAGRDSVAGTLPLVVMVLALAIAVFGAVVAATSQAGARTAAWQQVGADARLNGLGFQEASVADGRRVDGVRALAGLATRPTVLTSRSRQAPATLVVTSVADLRAVQDDVPRAPVLPESLQESLQGSGSAGPRVPVAVRAGVAAVGDEVVVEVGTRELDAVVVATGGPLPGVAGARPWVLLDDAVAQEAGATVPVPGAVVVALEPDVDDVSAVQADLRAAMGTSGVLTTREAVLERVQDQPLVRGTLASFALSTGVAGGLVALAVVLTLVAGAPDRGRLLSRLRTLGLSARQAGGLVAWEVGPLVLTAAVAGTAAGLLVPLVVLPGVDLRAFTGGDSPPALAVDVAGVAVVAGGFVAVAAVGVLVVLAASHRARLGTVLRVGDES